MSRSEKAGAWDAEVLVIGAGAWGAMATWRLAVAGVDVLALERFTVPHAHGSSHGVTRLFRAACLEHPGLTPLALHSAALYRELEDEGGKEILDQCGGLTIGPRDGAAIRGVLDAAALAGLSVEALDAAAIRERFPFHGAIDDADAGVFDPLSGVLYIETAVAEAAAAARRHGARFRSGAAVESVSRIPGGYRATTATESFRAPKVVLAAGSWTRGFLPDLPLKTTRMPMTWFTGSAGHPQASLADTGVFIREMGVGGGYWGHPGTATAPAKVGPRGAVARGDEPSVDGIDRAYTDVDAAAAEAMVSVYLPSLDPRAAAGYICHSTRTPDELFIVGELSPGLIVGAGESGHGGKHAAGVGAALAALATGTAPPVDIDFLSPHRFARQPASLAT